MDEDQNNISATIEDAPEPIEAPPEPIEVPPEPINEDEEDTQLEKPKKPRT
eukprot:SAG22_NODE_20373_length_265_cov_0.712575_1_plen_50_part_10